MSAPLRQRGMALLSVLLLTAVMTVLAVAMLDDIRFGLRRTGNAASIAQAQRYALGSEALARQRVGELQRAGVDAGQWNGRPLLFPIIEDGQSLGLVRARLGDGSTCFNLNSVVTGAPEQWRRQDLGVRQYIALLQALGFAAAQAQALADTLADWIDSDAERAPLGAEDATYAARSPGYRTSGALLAEPSELRAIHGYDDPTYARLRPYVCALPRAALSPVNVNALTPEQAPVLSMLSLGRLTPGEARRLIAARPEGGWPDATAFWNQPALRDAELSNEIYDQVQLTSRWFTLQTEVDYAGAQAVLSALLYADGDRARLIARRWTPDE
ncbi:type II secretion system minor pseudopilin GspK [Luteimonas sp BLCC-B24]|uniref:type II secretion system minor pseudopilin GspK n=1 Tax=Luteimonas sp. BLCC-B24 TaxID=3025317 RepID=UPI00234C0B49|nr:type II secretion system minor pseudopilin GspK [Luteimonas sp. BLCC-B24]MDC7805691.1 type II secretion system minor pseudopilin GspK [Luteimonas sp. BLCC-B24]